MTRDECCYPACSCPVDNMCPPKYRPCDPFQFIQKFKKGDKFIDEVVVVLNPKRSK